MHIHILLNFLLSIVKSFDMTLLAIKIFFKVHKSYKNSRYNKAAKCEECYRTEASSSHESKRYSIKPTAAASIE